VHSRRPAAPVARRDSSRWLVSCWRFGVDDRYGGPPRPVANLLEVAGSGHTPVVPIYGK
jgi:hypothetical protein